MKKNKKLTKEERKALVEKKKEASRQRQIKALVKAQKADSYTNFETNKSGVIESRYSKKK
jgi:ribonucleotide reductase alpha subunit